MADTNRLLIYNSATPNSLLAAVVFLNMFPESDLTTVKDINGVTTGDIATWIGTLDANAYDEIYLGSENGVVPATAKLSKTQVASLWGNLKVTAQGTELETGADADTHTTLTIGLSTLTMTVNAYAGKWLYINGGTGAGQMALIVSNTATVITVASVFDTTPDATSDFSVIDTDMGMIEVGNTVSSYQAGARMWSKLYPGTPPLVVYRTCDPRFATKLGTATSVANGSLTHTGAFTGLDLTGYWVYIYSSTLGKHQKRQIASNTNDVLTLEADWTVNPTGTIVYRVVATEEWCFMDKYIANYIMLYLTDLSDSGVNSVWINLIDRQQNADELAAYEAPDQDFEFIDVEMLMKGKTIEEWIAKQ